MNKSHIFYKFSEIETRRNRGTYWIGIVQSLFDPQKILLGVASIKIIFPNYFSNTTLITFFIIYMLLIEFIKYFIGELDERLGLWKKQSEYSAKKDHISPFNFELKETLEGICKKVGSESKFKDL